MSIKELPDVIKENWLKLLIVILSGTIVGDLANFWDLSSTREDNYIKKYIELSSNCNSQINKLKEEINTLNNRLLILEVTNQEIPFPYWVKDKEGVIINLSDIFVKHIIEPNGFTKNQVLNTKGEVFGQDFVEKILKNDALVIKNNKTLMFKEPIPFTGNGISYKFPYYGPGGTILGTAGIWIPENIEKYSKSYEKN